MKKLLYTTCLIGILLFSCTTDSIEDLLTPATSEPGGDRKLYR
ncbi:hypothetical protein N7U66_06240 [Lacinutrix neustonica]|uniref:Lipoprotein n=1 Tax=Lacinutrix neustonica TaxID=2980107 RepID=A0A9E8SEG4_9FLAO|nr:hypothetical protein [Lacinutrix neustonica]WAC03186.1 hypothetical protein N7U66_06240 [Lacinutrix neustonica]